MAGKGGYQRTSLKEHCRSSSYIWSMGQTITCIRCHQDKTSNEFYTTRSRRSGYYPYCKSCCSTKSHARWQQLRSGGQVQATGQWATTPKAMREPTRDEIAWAAGFIEGEGHFKVEKSYGVSIIVAQVNREPLEKLQTLFGGTIKTIQARPGHQQYHVWKRHGLSAAAIAELLYPWLSRLRQSQVDALLIVVRTYRKVLRRGAWRAVLCAECGMKHFVNDRRADEGQKVYCSRRCGGKAVARLRIAQLRTATQAALPPPHLGTDTPA